MERIDLFDRYIKGELSEDENIKFKERLESEEDFASDFRIYSLSVIGICKEAEQNNADFGNAMKHLTKEQLFDIIRRKEKPIGREDIIDRLQSRIILNRAQRTELSGAAALNDIDDDDYSEDESEYTDKKEVDNEKQVNSGNSLQRFTLIFIFIIILLIGISILM
ncbi:MAG: hypothetical protein HDR98_08035 [Bacteroides sp.]|nr:hypothetical protein [Bacteroides sp.]